MFTFSSSYARDVFAQAQERLVTICENYVQEHNTSPDTLGTELPNILIAIQICEKQHNLISLGFLIHSTGEMLLGAGHKDKYQRWLELILSDTSIAADTNTRDLLLALIDDYANTLNSAGERSRALILYERLLSETEGDPLLQAFAHLGLGAVQLGASRIDLARNHWLQARANAQECNAPDIVTLANYFLGEPDNHSDVLVSLEQAPFSRKPKSANWRRYLWCQMQAMRHFQRKEYTHASTLYCEALQLATTLADERGKALAMFHLGEIARVQDRIDEALHYLHQSEDIARRMDDQTGLASIYASLGRLYLYQEQYSLALPNLRECVLLESAWGETRILAENLYWLGYALANTGRIEEAQDCFLRARAIFMHMDQERVTDVDRALARLEAALEAGT